MMNEINNEDMNDIFYSISKKYILPKYKNLKDTDIKYKNKNDLVTTVDINIENELRIFLKKIFPSAFFIGEESFEKNKSIVNNYNEKIYCWTVDPIDGTKNFIKGRDQFAIMVGLSYKNKILQSWIYKPINEEMCYSLSNAGSFIEGVRIKCNNKTDFEKSKGSVSIKYWDEKYLKKIISLKKKFSEIINFGCIGYEYIEIAKGNKDFALISKLSPWDHLPGILIARESGAFDSYFDSGKYDFNSSKYNLIVTNNNIFGNKILSYIKGETL